MTGFTIVVTLSSDGTMLSEQEFDKDVVTIGRTTGNDVCLPDVEKRVSSRHARIERRPNAWVMIDLGSTNGTIINEKKIEANQPVPLKTGDHITLGVFVLRFMQAVEEPSDQTIVHVDPSRQAAKIADAASLVYARHANSTPEERLQAVKDVLRTNFQGTPKESLRAVSQQVRARFEGGAEKVPGGERGTMVRKRDAAIKKQEEMYQAGARMVNELSERFLGEAGFTTPEQMARFSTLIEQALNITFDWLGNSLKGRREFENQFSADLTMVFSREGNPLKAAAAASEMGRFLLDWRGQRTTDEIKGSLEAAFKDLTMHQLGLLAGVQDALKAALGRLDPKMIEAEAAGGGMFAKMNATKRAWEIYVVKHREMFEENSKLFNEVIYPNIRKGYLASHAPAEPDVPPKTS